MNARLTTASFALLSFPPFVLDVADRRLFMNGQEVSLRRKPFAVLCCLASKPHRLVTHEEIADTVWGTIARSDSLVRTHVRDLRRRLGSEVIETVVGRGYRFIAHISESRAPGIDLYKGTDVRRQLATIRSVLSGLDRSKVRLQLAAIRAVADELQRCVVGESPPVASSLVQQLAEELEHLAGALRASSGAL